MTDERLGPGEDSEAMGFAVDDLAPVMREMFLQCIADARGAVDPAVDFDAFVERLWQEVAAAFGLIRQDWPEETVKPWPALLEDQRGYAEAVLDGRIPPGQLPS